MTQEKSANALETLFTAGRATTRRLSRSRLVVVDGPDRGKSVDMDKSRATVGRSMICDLCVTDRSVSGTHAEIEAVESGYIVRDLGSTNGCFVGEVRLKEAIVPLGARVRFGGTTVQIEPGKGVVDIPLSSTDRFHELVGRSVPMRQIFAELEKVAPSDLTVLIAGETGTGKELVARALHKASKRSSGPLVVQDCSAMPRDLVESVLFGHERGSFTGAIDRKIGSFEQAQGGTLFLDEIGELDLGLQPKLLRVLENREVRRVGGDKTLPVDVRVVAATNRDLRQMVSNGTFREDLYYRLGVVVVELPPLRARREDIPLIAQSMLEQFCKRHPDLGPRSFSKEVLDRLSGNHWAGNVRELRNVVERAGSLADGAEITLDDLMPASALKPFYIPEARLTESAVSSAGEVSQELGAIPFKDAKARVLESFEPAYLRALLVKHNGNITRSALSAGLTRYHLRELCKRYGLRSVDGEPEQG